MLSYVRNLSQSFLHAGMLVCLVLACNLSVIAASETPNLDLRKYIDDALAKNQRMIVLPAGTFHVAQTTVLDHRYADLTLTGLNKTTLVMTRLEPLFFFKGCRNITLDGITLDYHPLPFTQASITKITGKTVEFQVHDGYPRLTAAYLTTHQLLLFDKDSRNWKWGHKDNWQKDLKRITDSTGQFTLAHPSDHVQVGDLICLDSRVGRAFFLRDQAKDIAFTNITLFAAPGLCFDARRTAGQHRFNNVVVTRGPTPAGATQARLISSSADGINYADTRQGPIIENCDLSWMGDDGVNLHGSVLPVIRVDDDGSFLTVMGWRPKDLNKIILPGDEARVLASKTFAVAKKLKVVSFEPMEGLEGVSMAQVKRYYHAASIHEMGLPSFILYRMKLADGVPKEGQYIDVPGASCPGYSITNSRFANHRARGLRIMASHGTISHNTFEQIQQAAIYLGPEYSSWMEGGWVNHISVFGNKIRNVCQGSPAWSQYYYGPGAIAISGHPDQGDNMIYPGNHNIILRDNHIDGSGVSAIAILAGEQILLKNNTFSRVNTASSTQNACRSFGVQYQPVPIFIWDKATRQIQIDPSQALPN